MFASLNYVARLFLTGTIAASLMEASTGLATADPLAYRNSITCSGTVQNASPNPFTCSSYVPVQRPVRIEFVSTSCAITAPFEAITVPSIFMGVNRIELTVGSNSGNMTYELNAGPGPSAGDTLLLSQISVGQTFGTFYGTSQPVRIYADAGAVITATVKGISTGFIAGASIGGNPQCNVVISGQVTPNDF